MSSCQKLENQGSSSLHDSCSGRNKKDKKRRGRSGYKNYDQNISKIELVNKAIDIAS
jgi:hypothetical protein